MNIKNKLLKFYEDYISDNSIRVKYLDIDDDLLRDLKGTVKDNAYKQLYRGLHWNDNDKKFLLSFNESFTKRQLYKTGDTLTINLREYISSWTTNPVVAEEFAMLNDNYGNHYGIILKLENVHKKNIVADFRNLNKYEEEVLLRPGIYNIKIYKIIMNEKEIDSMNEWSNIVTNID